MTTRLQNYINEEETQRDNTDALIETTYFGANPKITGRKGQCYFAANDDMWYFRPYGSGEWYRVRVENLKNMVEA